MTPSAQLIRSGPDALSVSRGKSLARFQPAHHASGYLTNLLPGASLVYPVRPTRAGRLGRGPSRAASGPFLSRPEIDHLAHVASAKPSFVVADEEGNAELFCGSRNSFRGRENSSEREKGRE